MNRLKSLWLTCYPYLLFTFIGLPAILIHLGTYPPVWYDEGFRMNAARTLSVFGQYGTYTADGLNPFDPTIATGPIDVLSISISFKLFGVGVMQARVGILPFSLLGIFAIFLLAKYLYDQQAAVFISLFILAIPPINGISYFMLSRQVMGEIPAVSLVLIGLWIMFLGWEKNSLVINVVSGLLIGVGLLSKTQMALYLVPALFLVCLVRTWREQRGIFRYSIPLFTIVIFLIVLKILEYSSWSDAFRTENLRFYSDSFRTTLVSRGIGQNLTIGGIFISGVSILTIGLTGWQIYAKTNRFHRISDKTWGVVLFGLIAIFSAIWVSLFSINWTRYLFPGWVFSMLLLGNLIWIFISTLFENNNSRLGSFQWKPITLAMMVVVVGLTSYGFILKNKGDSSAELMAKYIRENVPQDKLIETWEWQIDAISQHWKIHHPSSEYQTLAIEQRFIDQESFDLGYDFQKFPADYLLVGAFSEWTHIYNPRIIDKNFKQIAQFGPYRLYERLF